MHAHSAQARTILTLPIQTMKWGYRYHPISCRQGWNTMGDSQPLRVLGEQQQTAPGETGIWWSRCHSPPTDQQVGFWKGDHITITHNFRLTWRSKSAKQNGPTLHFAPSPTTGFGSRSHGTRKACLLDKSCCIMNYNRTLAACHCADEEVG